MHWCFWVGKSQFSISITLYAEGQENDVRTHCHTPNCVAAVTSFLESLLVIRKTAVRVESVEVHDGILPDHSDKMSTNPVSTSRRLSRAI